MIKAIPGYEDYYADTNGNIWSKRKYYANKEGELRKLKPQIGKFGYLTLEIRKNTKRKTRLVHRLVLETFVGLRPEGMQACHWDGVKSNNNLSNLRWDTAKNNKKDSIRLGTTFHPEGEKHPNAKLNSLQIRIIRKYPRYRGCLLHLSEYFGVSGSHIFNIRVGKKWRHL